jgi:hypothetical protein
MDKRLLFQVARANMEKKHLKYCLIYLIDKGAPRKTIVEELIHDNRIHIVLDIFFPPTEEEVDKTIDELLISEELVCDKRDNMLFVTEFMPNTANRITGKNYTKENVKKTWQTYCNYSC